MAMTGEIALALAKSYVNETLQGGGAVVGKNVIISSIEPIEGGHRITFAYTLDSGEQRTQYLDVMDGKDGFDGTNGLNGKDGADGFSPIITPDADNTDEVYKLDITTVNGTFTTENLKGDRGEQGVQGLRGERGEAGQQGIPGERGERGEKGNDGYPFLIYKEYETIDEFRASDFPQAGLMFMVKTQDEFGAFPVYRYTGESNTPYSYITSLSAGEAIKGDKGDKGDPGSQGLPGLDGRDGKTYMPVIGTVTNGETANASVVVDEDTATAKFSFVLPKGNKGDKGDTGAKGDKGDTGSPGKDGADGKTYIPTIGTVQNGDTAQASINIDEQDLKAKFNFTLPKGDKGNDGRSIESITTDEDNNLIVTYDDGDEQTVGKLSFDIQGNFLTSNGFGNLRYYNGKLEYWNTDSEKWVETSVTPDNVYILNITTQNMQSISGVYDTDLGYNKLRWKEPADTVLDNQVVCVVESVDIRRKLNSEPIDENDGDLVISVDRADFGTHENEWYIDTDVTPQNGDKYYYKAFPISTTGFYNNSNENAVEVETKTATVYGFIINQNESNPDSMITYIENNEGFKPAHMNYATDTFDYGDWKDAFFMQVRPCMLNYDGTVAYYLNPNNYALREDGQPSDIANVSFGGNAMVQFPKIYWKIVDNGNNTANVYISDAQVDDDFRCWSHIDANGNVIDYCYMPIYNGSNQSNVLRSLSGKTLINNTSGTDEITYALANNRSGSVIWHTEVFADRMLVNLLLLLIGKSTDTQKVFGNGYVGASAYVFDEHTITGQMNSKGLFYGKNDTMSGVKVFGIENWWGTISRRVAGYIKPVNSNMIIKLTYGKQDGSTVDGYNTNGNGYITIPNSEIKNAGGYIREMIFSEYGLFGKITDGSTSTYYTDKLTNSLSQTAYAGYGGDMKDGLNAGAFAVRLLNNVSNKGNYFSASVSCKPLAQ